MSFKIALSIAPSSLELLIAPRRFLDATKVTENCLSASLMGGRIMTGVPVAVEWRILILAFLLSAVGWHRILSRTRGRF